MSSEEERGSKLPPRAELRRMLNGFWYLPVLRAAARLGIPDLLAKNTMTATELATATGANEDAVRRLMRALVTVDVVTEAGGDGKFSLAPVGQLLRADAPDSMRAMVLHFAEIMWPSWSSLVDSVRGGKSARQLLGQEDVFGALAADPEKAEVFNAAMAQFTRQAAQEVARHYDFARIGKLVDVGGGYGELVITILRAYPSMRGIIYDMEHSAEGARRNIAHAGLEARCEFVAGDFFKNVPGGADACILKSIVHDWDDARAVTILKNCRAAMARHGRVLIVERIMPDTPQTTPEHQALAMADLNMLVGPGGRERTEAEFRALLAAAGLRLARIVKLGEGPGVIEAVRADNPG